MDGHYEQVMKARAAAGQGTRSYFAYSTILDRAAFVEWRSQHGYDSFELPKGELAEAQGIGLVYDFASRWWGGRVAGLEDKPGASVWGVLFEISEKDWAIIQHKEGAITQMCSERPLKVTLSNGDVREAFAFTTRPERRKLDGPVSDRFVAALEGGARSAGLPQAWIDSLKVTAR